MATERKAVPTRLRKQVWEATQNPTSSEGVCMSCRCKVDIWTFESGHIKSVAEGGTTTLDNLLVVCSMCNKSMSKMDFYDFVARYYPQNMKYLPRRGASVASSTSVWTPKATSSTSTAVVKREKRNSTLADIFTTVYESLWSSSKTKRVCAHILVKGPNKGTRCTSNATVGRYCSKHVSQHSA